MRLLFDIIVALVILPVFLGLALLFGVVFGLVGGGASAFVSAWPILVYYHDRFLTGVIPPAWRNSSRPSLCGFPFRSEQAIARRTATTPSLPFDL
jgi:hypothetical protein